MPLNPSVIHIPSPFCTAHPCCNSNKSILTALSKTIGITAKNRSEGQATVSVFEVDEILFSKLKSLHFDKADREWLQYISANRTGAKVREDYDVIIGPVANDQAIRTVNNYLKGYFSEDIAIQLLLPQKLKDQYTFKTEKALTVLRFKEEIIL